MQGVMINGELNRMKTAKTVVADYLNELRIIGPVRVTTDDVYVVWFCKTLQNWKALLSTDLTNTGIYFEVTYNGDHKELYLDHYRKIHNRAIPIEEE
jgi:hypothetical protein